MTNSTPIRDLAVLGDRRTAAFIRSDAAIVWYCPERFDRPSLLAALLDAERGGAWTVDLPDARPDGRDYVEDSSVLVTRLANASGALSITDWMPLGPDTPEGICRQLSPPPCPVTLSLMPAPDYARSPADLQPSGTGIRINEKHWIYASHPLRIEEGCIRCTLPAGESGWAALLDAPLPQAPSQADLQNWLDQTLKVWDEIASRITYHGPYESQVAQSLRALRLLGYAPNGGIIAAASTSLPEVPGGQRNYDYRYVWLRDTGMIVSALVRAGSKGEDERRFLAFICGSIMDDPDRPLLPPFVSLDQQPAPSETRLALAGYDHSRPLRIGNGANKQLQLDGFANVLLAAKLIYGRYQTREHWQSISRIADYLAAHWQEADYGIWEENQPAQYTTGKVISACALHYIAQYTEDPAQAKRWHRAVADIRDYVARNCINAEGAYAAIAGEQAVDISAILYPVWGYTAPDAPEMLATLRVLERDHSDGDLYWRHLEDFDARKEGAFLAGTIWVAQYWVMRKDLQRARAILDAALEYATDLGFFAEEADPASGQMLGNFPQSFVHGSFIGAVVDYKNALEEQGREEEGGP